MENLTLLNVYFNGIDITWLCVIVGIYGFCALCRIDNAIESQTPMVQTGARIVKMTMLLLLLSFSGLSQDLKQIGSSSKFVITDIGRTFDTTKLVYIRTWLELDDSTTTNPCERFFRGRNELKMTFENYGIFYIKLKQKREDMDYDHVDFHVTYFANIVKIIKTVGISYAVPRDLRD